MDVVFDLTPMTRHADAERKIVIEGFEADKRRIFVAGAGAIPGMLLAGLLAGLLGALAIIPPIVTAVLAIWLFDSRSRKGLRLRHWDAFKDRRKSTPKFRYCGRVINPDDTGFYRIRSLSAPVVHAATPEWLDAAEPVKAKRAVADSWGETPPVVASPYSVDGW